jgi:hypothetical protein
MNDYCVDLNLNINPLMDGVSFKDLQDGEKYWTLINPKYINPELKTLFESLGLQVMLAALFVTEGYKFTERHLDGWNEGDLTKINWSSNNQHNMIWYEMKDHDLSKKKFYVRKNDSVGSRPYIAFDEDEVVEVYRSPVGNPSIIQGGIPHNLENYYEGISYRISILLIADGKPVTMSRAKEIFSKYIIEVDKL